MNDELKVYIQCKKRQSNQEIPTYTGNRKKLALLKMTTNYFVQLSLTLPNLNPKLLLEMKKKYINQNDNLIIE